MLSAKTALATLLVPCFVLTACGHASHPREAVSSKAPPPWDSPAAGAASPAPTQPHATADAAARAEVMTSTASSPATRAPQAPPPAPQQQQHAQPVVQAPGQPYPQSIAQAPPEPQGTEHDQDYGVNAVTDPSRDRFSTFSIDVDTASYAISRRKLNEGTLPHFASVRAEEYLNYFRYDYGPPASRGAPFAVHLAAAPSPYAAGHHVMRVALQGRRVAAEERTPVHLVYLVDVSGSMMAPDRIELAKHSLRLLTDALKPGDTVALCTYAGNVREVLAPTGVDQRARILGAIDALTAGGSTAMASGIQLAYDLASRTLVKGHVNRVVVLSDGDANVGNTSHQDILKMIRGYREKGITLSTVGFGSGNYKDVMMEQLADQGDGNYAYIDSDTQARRVFTEQVDGLLQVIARDVKIQVEFNPQTVKSYRLIGYENRDIADRDFRNDRVDAGEVGAGHSVTAMYDVVLSRTDTSPVTVRIRHKAPLGSDKAVEAVFPMSAAAVLPSFEAAPADFRFATAVAGFAEILRKSPHAREISLGKVEQIAAAATNDRGERNELVGLVRKASALSGGPGGAMVAR